MSLLDQFTAEYVLLEKTRVSDGEGGFTTTWSDGITISMAMRHDTTIEAMRAEQEGVTSTFTFLVPKNISLEYHDVVRRVSDGQHFRITSNTGGKTSPEMASFALTEVTAEKWSLT